MATVSVLRLLLPSCCSIACWSAPSACPNKGWSSGALGVWAPGALAGSCLNSCKSCCSSSRCVINSA
eukprot:888559-Prorocentrum_lima.AAC.1